MILTRFRIETDYTPPLRWFDVRIYDTPEALRKVASRITPTDDYSECVGTVQEITPMVPEDTVAELQDLIPVELLGFPDNGFAGVIRLCEEYLTPSVIAHEILHAAVVVFRMNICQLPKLEGLLSPERPREEALAYAVGELSGQMETMLRKHGWE